MLKRPRDMEERLGKLPDDLEAAYDEIYTSIQAQKGSGSEIAFRAFQWVITAYRPLSPEELVFAVCQDPSKDSLEEVDFGIDFVLESCHNLLILDEVQNVCRLAHLSVQEYFERHCSQPQANTLAAKICFIVLNDPTYWKYEHSWVPIGSKVEVAVQKNYSESHDLEVPWISEELVSREDRASPPLRSSPLRRYASYHWISHVEQHEKEPVIDRRVTELLEKFLRDTINGSLAYQRWQSIDIRNRPVPFTICASGLYRVLSSEWWDIGIVNVHQKDANGDSLLTWAVRAGSRDIAKHLLDRGADPDSRSWISSPLMLAASSLDEKMIQLLLTYKANINAFGNEESALVNAVKQQRIGNVKLLLAAKADLNIPERRQPLAVAVEVRNAELVRLLLEAGADANTIMYDGRYGSALIGVVSWGHYGLLLLFLEKGANVNAKANGKYGSALAAAARGRELEHRLYTHSFRNRLPIGTSGEESLTRDGKILNLLLKHGAEVNKEVGGAYGCALVAAARGGNQETVNLLLKKGANINCRVGGSYGTPLIAAVRRAALSCEEEDLSTVKLLLSLGADVNAKVGRDYTAFSAAGDNDKVLQLLKSYGAVEDGEEKRLRKIISALEFQESSSEETDTLSDESS
jgi:ankyrin repeat protein